MIITAGIYKGRKLNSPDKHISRPTLSKVRMGVFNSLYSLIGDFNDKSFLDVFGGSGIMGLEALSRGFKEVKVFEHNINSANIIKKNYKLLNIEPDITVGDSIKLVDKLEKKYDVAYIDPPFESNLYEHILPKINAELIIIESNRILDYPYLTILKSKKYGNSIITFAKNQS